MAFFLRKIIILEKNKFNTMKKLWILPLAALMMVACGGEKEDDGSSESAANSEYAEAKQLGLTDADINKAVEVGTKMQECYECESAPGAYDSKMTDDCDPLMEEYKAYCAGTFGTDDYHEESDGGKKVDAFRTIMFDVRGKKCKE